MMALPLTTASVVNGSEVAKPSTDLVSIAGSMAGRVHRRDADVLLDVEAAAAGDEALPGVHDAADALDGDGLALQRLGAVGERRLVGDAGGVGDVLAQHQLDQRPVDQVGDGEQPLPRRGRPQEHRPGADGEVGAARDHRVGRGDADQDAVRDLQPLLLVESGVLGDEGRAEGQRRGRQRHQDLDILRLARQWEAAQRRARGPPRPMSVFEHPILPYNRRYELP